MIVLRAERLPTTWTIMFPTFRVCKSVFEKRNPQVRIVIGFPLLSLWGKYPQAKCPVCLRHRRHRLRPRRPRPSADRLGQAARPARRRGDREQEAVELKSKLLFGMNEVHYATVSRHLNRDKAAKRECVIARDEKRGREPFP